MKDKTKIKVLITSLIFAIIFISGALLYFQVFPSYSQISPSIYFNYNILWNASVPQFYNLLQFKLTGDSMLPTIPNNSVALAVPPDIMGEIQINNIIVFYLPALNRVVAHRVVGIRNGKYLTKGDNVKYSDQYWINKSQIMGKIVAVFY